MRRTLLTALVIIMIVTTAGAVTSNKTGTSEGADTGASFATNVRKSFNKSKTTGDLTTDSNGWRNDNQDSTSLKKTANVSKTGDLSASVNATALLAQVFIPIEKNSKLLAGFPQKRLVEALKSKAYSRPTLNPDVGITGESQSGVFDNSLTELLHHAGSSNPYIATFPMVDEAKVLRIAENYLFVGAIGWQALRHVQKDVAILNPQLKAGKKITTTAKKKGIHTALKQVTDADIIELGEADIKVLFLSAVCRVLNEGIVDGDIADSLESAIKSLKSVPCRLKGNAETISCGIVLWALNNPPEVTVGGMQWLGKGFGGMDVSWRLSNAWSYSEALDKAATVNKTSNVAHEFAKRVDNSIAKGKGRDAITDMKAGVTASENATNDNTAGK